MRLCMVTHATHRQRTYTYRHIQIPRRHTHRRVRKAPPTNPHHTTNTRTSAPGGGLGTASGTVVHGALSGFEAPPPGYPQPQHKGTEAGATHPLSRAMPCPTDPERGCRQLGVAGAGLSARDTRATGTGARHDKQDLGGPLCIVGASTQPELNTAADSKQQQRYGKLDLHHLHL